MVNIDKDVIDMAAFGQKAKIRVIGVGGGGNNAVDRMIEDGVEGIDFIAVNTDAQALHRSKASIRIQLGEKLTAGLGAGGVPMVGAKAAEESRDQILKAIGDSNMLFVTCGMGGGTGTGAAPIIAGLAKDLGILTVGIVTKPFAFEGKKRMSNANEGIEELRQHVDTLLTIPNERLMEVLDESVTFKDALKKADEVLTQSVQGISTLISHPGDINLDFADVKTIMQNKGLGYIGIGSASGKNRAMIAAENAINSPMLETSIQGAGSILLNITGAADLGLHEVTAAASFIQESTGVADDNIIYGTSINEDLKDQVIITVVATAFEEPSGAVRVPQIKPEVSDPVNSASAPVSASDRSDSESNGQIKLPIFVQRDRK
ncbi:MAG: cell division protein FtsZ [Defluviitaleaceae bacterium]|nr:cell division protein FtsZ [Defluviitaleaceae bacterium]